MTVTCFDSCIIREPQNPVGAKIKCIKPVGSRDNELLVKQSTYLKIRISSFSECVILRNGITTDLINYHYT